MDTYSKVILVMACINAMVVIVRMIHLSATGKAEIKAVKAKNKPVTPLNYEQWQAERIAANKRKAKATAEFQELKELNADFSAIISGE